MKIKTTFSLSTFFLLLKINLTKCHITGNSSVHKFYKMNYLAQRYATYLLCTIFIILEIPYIFTKYKLKNLNLLSQYPVWRAFFRPIRNKSKLHTVRKVARELTYFHTLFHSYVFFFFNKKFLRFIIL